MTFVNQTTHGIYHHCVNPKRKFKRVWLKIVCLFWELSFCRGDLIPAEVNEVKCCSWITRSLGKWFCWRPSRGQEDEQHAKERKVMCHLRQQGNLQDTQWSWLELTAFKEQLGWICFSLHRTELCPSGIIALSFCKCLQVFFQWKPRLSLL